MAVRRKTVSEPTRLPGAVSCEELVRLAREARHKAYAPYSKYKVGAALVTRSGRVFTGCNVENASYGLAICAERNAIFQAVAAGEHEIAALAVVTSNGGSPCGACRQVIAEFAQDDTRILFADARGRIHAEYSMDELLPARFRPSHLPVT